MILDIWKFKDKSSKLFQNVGHQSQSDATKHPRRTDISTMPFRKTNNSKLFFVGWCTLGVLKRLNYVAFNMKEVNFA
jgi:hypothetical protein